MNPRPLPLDWGQIVVALEEPEGGGTRAFLDRTTGAVEFVPRDLDEDQRAFDDIFSAPHRWMEIPGLPLWQQHRLRGRFVDEVTDPQARILLTEALESSDPFTRFRRVLRQFPVVADEWLLFRDRALERIGRAWLTEIGLAQV